MQWGLFFLTNKINLTLLGATALRCVNSGAREDKNIYV